MEQGCLIAGGSAGRSVLRRRCTLVLPALVATLALLCAGAGSAFANAPNPTSIKVDSAVAHGSEVTVTVSGTWTWLVPNGAQQDCNDSRIGVGYAVGWGDNTANPLKSKHAGEPTIYVGSASDDWVHSVTQGTQCVAGPFKKGPATLEESMLGETPEAMLGGFGPQGISTGASTAIPTNADAERWVSSCGPTAQIAYGRGHDRQQRPERTRKRLPERHLGPDLAHVHHAGPAHDLPGDVRPARQRSWPAGAERQGNHRGRH